MKKRLGKKLAFEYVRRRQTKSKGIQRKIQKMLISNHVGRREEKHKRIHERIHLRKLKKVNQIMCRKKQRKTLLGNALVMCYFI